MRLHFNEDAGLHIAVLSDSRTACVREVAVRVYLIPHVLR